MENNLSIPIMPAILVCLAAFTIGLVLGDLVQGGAAEEKWQKTTAQTECARYHPDTGKFEWIKEVK